MTVQRARLHPVAWAAWLAAALVVLSSTRNPLYLALTLLCIAIVKILSKTQVLFSPMSTLHFALFVLPLSALFNAATVHFGDTVLWHLPTRLPLLGGAVTLEALVFGALNGLVLSGIFAAFATLNQALSTRDLIRLVPQAFYTLAVVLSIALTFVPTTLRQFQQIRDAQAVRGHRMRGLVDWLPLFMPLLVSGLERALQLAEAMTARGFAGADVEPLVPAHTTTQSGAARGAGGPAHRPRIAILFGLLMLLGGWLLRLAWRVESWGGALMLAGGVLILGALWAMGRQNPRTSYRRLPWTWRDWAVLSAALVLALAFTLPGLERSALYYYPYPALSLPDFDPAFGLVTLGLLGPVVLLA